jgi:hypothetical protein
MNMNMKIVGHGHLCVSVMAGRHGEGGGVTLHDSTYDKGIRVQLLF